MIRFIVLLFFLLIWLPKAQAQSNRIQSLQDILKNHSQRDTFRINRLNELAHLIGQRSVSQGDSLANNALTVARQLNYLYGQAQALTWQASFALSQQQVDKAQQLLAQALILAEPLADKRLLTDILRFTGKSYSNQGDKALPYYQQAIAVAKTSGQPIVLTKALHDLATYYAYRFMFPSALTRYFQALKTAEQARSTEDEISILHGIAGVYLDLTDYERALSYLQQALKKAGPETKDEEIILLGDIGTCYMLTGRYSLAIAALQRGLTVSKGYKERPNFYGLPLEVNLADTYERQRNGLTLAFAQRVLAKARLLQDTYVLGRVSVTLGHYYLRAGLADSAIYYGKQAIAFSQQNQNKIRLRDACLILSKAYASRRKFPEAYDYQSRYITYKDSLNNEEVTRKTTAALFDDQMSRQKSQINLLTKNQQLQAEAAHRQTQLLYVSLAVLALIGGLVALLYRSNQHKQKANSILQFQKAEIQEQRDQLNKTLIELKDTQTQLIQKEKMASLGELTAGIAHEIQNPLNFVNNFSDLSTELVREVLQEEIKTEPDHELISESLADLEKNLQRISHHGQQASSIIKGMLEHARISTGELQPTDLNALIDEYLHLAYKEVKAKNTEFSCDLRTKFDTALGKINVVPQELGRVLVNLFNNAFYAVADKQKQDSSDYQPNITVVTRQLSNDFSTEFLEICVIDNGTGMPEATQKKVFQPFFTTKPPGQGTGLGLSLAFDIITKGYGGTLTVQSQEGQGTEFTIHLPLKPTKIA